MGEGLPNDPTKIARIARVSLRRWHLIAEDVMAFFDVGDGIITQKRLVEEYQKTIYPKRRVLLEQIALMLRRVKPGIGILGKMIWIFLPKWVFRLLARIAAGIFRGLKRRRTILLAVNLLLASKLRKQVRNRDCLLVAVALGMTGDLTLN
ncbi:MAG: hypothetical protein JSC189_000898 [Candidatus Tokpelaia sp. JSC189]|nr:MAG: hypothetical protein JSC189_000898 [Candidatus Tokpelaia sp. JSC189]